jgi:hypothetical protein
LFWVSAAMTALACHVAPSLPSRDLHAHDLPSPTGLMVFEAPLAGTGPSASRPPGPLLHQARYRRSLIRERTAEKQRVEKLLEDAQVKLSSVASNIFGVSGRQMLAAMLAGQLDPQVLARMAHGRMRSKIPQLQEALTGQFTAHHAFVLQMMLYRIDDLTRGSRRPPPGSRIRLPLRPHGRATRRDHRHRRDLRPGADRRARP